MTGQWAIRLGNNLYDLLSVRDDIEGAGASDAENGYFIQNNNKNSKKQIDFLLFFNIIIHKYNY